MSRLSLVKVILGMVCAWSVATGATAQPAVYLASEQSLPGPSGSIISYEQMLLSPFGTTSYRVLYRKWAPWRGTGFKKPQH